VSRAYILDLSPGHSFIGQLLDDGIDELPTGYVHTALDRRADARRTGGERSRPLGCHIWCAWRRAPSALRRHELAFPARRAGQPRRRNLCCVMKFAYGPDTHFGVYDQDPPSPDEAARGLRASPRRGGPRRLETNGRMDHVDENLHGLTGRLGGVALIVRLAGRSAARASFSLRR
jgi:hypothetical protein